MDRHLIARLIFAGTTMYGVATLAAAQEPPLTQTMAPVAAPEPGAPATEPKAATGDAPAAQAAAPAPDSNAAVSAAPPVPDTPAQAPTPVAADASKGAMPTAGPRKVLMLSPEFTEYQNAVAGLEAMPNWTESARKNLGDAARDALRATDDMQFESLPELTPEESQILHDHLAVAELIVFAGVQHKTGEWHKHRAGFDRTFGDGLHFLRERTGADYALLIDGMQVLQSGGRTAMKWLGVFAAAALGVVAVPTGGGGEVLNVCLLDLNNGTVSWFNSSRAIDVIASSGADMRDAAATQAAMKKLFASYPGIPSLAD